MFSVQNDHVPVRVSLITGTRGREALSQLQPVPSGGWRFAEREEARGEAHEHRLSWLRVPVQVRLLERQVSVVQGRRYSQLGRKCPP